MLRAKIKRIHVKHFRSIAEETIELGDLTILVGQNAAGKSNVVDSIRFIRDALAEGLDQAVSVRNGVRVVRQASHAKKPFNIEIRLDFDVSRDPSSTEGPLHSTYGFKLSSSNDELLVLEETGHVIHSEIVVNEDEGFEFYPASQTLLERNRAGEVRLGDADNRKRAVATDELAMSRGSRVSLTVGEMFDARTVLDEILQGARFAAIYPNVMRAPAPSQAATTLSEDCRNWASVMRAMRKSKEGEEGLEKVIDLMRRVLPQLVDVSIKSIGGFLIPHFRFDRGKERRDMDLIPYQLSDGTLRLFGLLLALYQSPPATFLAVEEPEQMVHPGALSVLADAFNEAKERTQLLITTHSPYLLELFDANAIRVVSQDSDGTTVRPVSSRQLDLVKRKLMTLPEIMVMDGLEQE